MFIKAGQKLSKLYENAVFPDGVVDEGLFDEEHKIPLSAVQWISDQSRGSDDDSAITQDPTDPINTCSNLHPNIWRSEGCFVAPFLHHRPKLEFQLSTLSLELSSYEEGDSGGSISRFPIFHFNLHRLSSLHTLLNAIPAQKEKGLVCLLVAILEIECPTTITTKAGIGMDLLKLIVGDELDAVPKIVCGGGTALYWGSGEEGAVRKGDVAFLQRKLRCHVTPHRLVFIPILAATDLEITYTPSAPTTVSALPDDYLLSSSAH
ncbi:hypothetical protein FRB93_010247 [Tulasnella sp. JGI-2019a]|nr:hypothetical protein FRB93_010247 [Tulasnella sp. JGI-2019a]